MTDPTFKRSEIEAERFEYHLIPAQTEEEALSLTPDEGFQTVEVISMFRKPERFGGAKTYVIGLADPSED